MYRYNKAAQKLFVSKHILTQKRTASLFTMAVRPLLKADSTITNVFESSPKRRAKQNEISAYQITIHGSALPAANKYTHPFQGQSPNPHTHTLHACFSPFTSLAGVIPTNGRQSELNASDKRALISGWMHLLPNQNRWDFNNRTGMSLFHTPRKHPVCLVHSAYRETAQH